MRYILHIFAVKFLTILLLCVVGLNTVYAQSPSVFFNNLPKQVSEGSRVSVDIRIQSSTQSINAISGVLAFPSNLVNVLSISKDASIIDIWTREPKVTRNGISFEGVVLNPGFKGASGLVFRVNFEAKNTGTVFLNFTEGAILANDGLGTNVLAKLGATNFRIVPSSLVLEEKSDPTFPPRDNRLSALPVITEYSQSVLSGQTAFLKGKGEPNALTKIVFKDISFKSVGEKFLEFLQTKKKKLDEVLIKNNPDGSFEYITNNNLLAGVYNATPFLVDDKTNTEKPGFGVQFLVSDNKIVKSLVVAINILGLLIPIVGLGVIIYFIPWYSWRRMRVLKKKLGLEEEKLEISGHQLERQEKIADATADTLITPDRQK